MSDNFQQLDLFNVDKERKVINKPIRLIELFAGIGAQAKALEVLGVPFEHWKICEWAAPSIKAYNSIHIKDNTDYSKDLNKEQLIEYLDGNISTNYNEPCDVTKKPETWLRDTYNNCIATHNLMNIMKAHGKDFEIVDTDKYEYILTYSFPCQDLSLAGKRQGMETSQADGGTRSGLLWEVERILGELADRPQILLMENVPEVIGSGNVEHFVKWTRKLESLGYSNHFQILNGKDYGIPQNRRRCFMVSILGDYGYDFPLKINLKYRLKDFLEEEVDEKYYLSKKMLNFFIENTEKQKENGNGFTFAPVSSTDEEAIAKTVTTRNGSRMDDNFIEDKSVYGRAALNETIENQELENGDFIDAYNRTIKKDIAGSITTRVNEANNTFVAVKNDSCIQHDINTVVKVRKYPVDKEALKDLLKTHKDKVGISIDELASSLNTSKTNVEHWFRRDEYFSIPTPEIWFALKELLKIETNEFDKSIMTFEEKPGKYDMLNRAYDEEGISPTITTKDGSVNVVKRYTDKVNRLGGLFDKEDQIHQAGSVYDANGLSPCLDTATGGHRQPLVTEESSYSEVEKSLFTKDGNIKRYIGSDKIDEFKEGQMATTTFPNGYGHGPRTHNESIALNTIDRPSVKMNLRIRKLVPVECMKLMGFERKDEQAMREVGLSDSAIYHCAGDSIIVTCLMGLFGQLLPISEEELLSKISDYSTRLKNE